MKSNIALELVRCTEASAISAARTMGKGNVENTFKSAISAMRHTLEQMSIAGKVVMGSEELLLEQNEKGSIVIGLGGRTLELLLLPIDGPASCAQGGSNAISALAASENGKFLQTPDIDYEKIAVGSVGCGVIDLSLGPTENLKRLAEAKHSYVEDLTVVVLDRPRHTELIREIREAGARIRLIPEGEVGGALATSNPSFGIDLLMGIGRAREGLIAAAALYAMGGDMQMRPKPANRVDQDLLRKSGIDDLSHIFKLGELVSGEIFFAATGVTDSEFLEGVQFVSGGALSYSLVGRSASGTVRKIISEHHFDREPKY